MRIVCPKDPTHNSFSVIAHVAQEWLVDEFGNFLEVITNCTDVVHRPDYHDRYICEECNQEACVYSDETYKQLEELSDERTPVR